MFGMSVFQSVLERLKAEEEYAIAEQPRELHGGIRGLNAGFVADVGRSPLTDNAAIHRAYFDTAGEDMLAPAKPLPKPVMPQHLARVDPQDVALELSLSETDTPATLAEKRRRFAAENHPDRHHPDFRANATIRMKIANMLIDEAQRRMRIMRPDRA